MKDTSYLRLLSSLYISTFFIRTSFGIMLATLQIYLNITDKLIGFAILSAASPIFELGTVLFIGATVDRHGRKRILLAGLLTATFFLFTLAMTQNLYVIFAINACHGMAAGAILVSSLALLTDNAPKNSRGREMGAFDAVNLLGWVAGYAIGALFIEFLEGSLWQGYLIAGIMALCGFVYSYINIWEDKNEKTQGKIRFDNIIKVLKQRAVLLLTLPWFVVFMMIGAVMTFLTGSLHGLNIAPKIVAAGILGAGIALISTQVFYGRLSDTYGRMPIMIVGTIGFVGIMITVGAWFISSPSSKPEILKSHLLDHKFIFGPVLGLFGFMALAFGPSALSSLADEADPRMRGVTMAVYSVVISAGMFVGIVAVGGISDLFGGPGVLTFMIACAISMLSLVILRYVDVKSRITNLNMPPAANKPNVAEEEGHIKGKNDD